MRPGQAAGLPILDAGEDDGAGQQLQVAKRNRRVPVAGGHDLALLRDLEPAAHRSPGLAKDRAVEAPTPSTDRATTAVEDRQLDPVSIGRRREGRLRPIDQPVGCEEARLLVRVGIPKHDFLAIATAVQVGAVPRVRQDRTQHSFRGFEGHGRFEQGNDVEFDRPGSDGSLREVEDIDHVRDLLGEADHDPARSVGAKPFPDSIHGPKRLEDLAEGHPCPDLARGGRRRSHCLRGPNGLDRGAVDGRVLADLELGQVESEGLDLPTEILDGPSCHSNQPVGHEGLLDHIEVGQQVGWRLVPASGWPRVPGQVVPRPPEPFGNRPEPATVGFVRKAPTERGVEVREVVGIVEQSDRQLSIHSRRRNNDRDCLHQAGRHGLMPPEDVIGLDPGGVLRDLGGDTGMPVTITPDPAAESHDRRQRRSGRRSTAMGWSDRRQQGTLHRGHERVEGRIEEDKGGPDFVERSRDLGPNLGGPPQDHQFLAKAVVEHPGGARRQARIISGFEDPGNAAEGHEGGPASRLRGMGGEHRMNSQVPDHAESVDGIVWESTCAPQRRDDPGQGVVGAPLLGPTATLLEDPDPVPLLR